VYCTAGFAVAWNNWQHPQVAALIPALFWATERHLQLRRASSLVPIALAAATMLVGGFPAVVAYALMVLVPYVGVRLVGDSVTGTGRVDDDPTDDSPDADRALESRPPPTRSVGGIWMAARKPLLASVTAGVGLVLGVTLAGFVVVPFQEHLGNLALDWRQQNPELHLPISALATAVVPNALGAPKDGLLIGDVNTVETLSFVGAVAVVLLAAALLLRPPAKTPWGVRGYLAVALLATVVLTYVGGPLLELAQKAPIFDTNFVGRLRSVLGFEVAVLAGLGAQSVLERRWPRTRLGWVTGIGGVLVLVGFLGAAFLEVNDLARAQGERWYVVSQAVVPAIAGVVALGVVVWLLLRRPSGGRQLLLGGLGALVALEALVLVVPRLPRIDEEDFYPATAVHDYLAEHLGSARYASSPYAMYPNTNAIYGLRTVTGHVHHQPTWGEMLAAADPAVFSQSPTYSALHTEVPVMTSPILDRMGTRYFVTSPGEAPPGTLTPPDPAATERIAVGPDGVSVTVPARRLRAVSVLLADEVGETDQLVGLAAEIEGATGQRRIFEPVGPGRFTIPVPGEDLADDGTMTVTVRSLGETPLEVFGSGGEPAIGFIEPVDDGLTLVSNDGAVVYERAGVMPRVRWAAHARVADDPGDRLALLARGLEPDTVMLAAGEGGGDGRPATVEVTQDDPEALTAEVEAEGAGWLVVADAMQHGWVATLDGEEVPLVAADHAFVAVAVPEGRHEIALRYEGEGRRTGLLLTALTVPVLAVLGGAGLLRRRRDGAQARA
jgi:hypothetical protein